MLADEDAPPATPAPSTRAATLRNAAIAFLFVGAAIAATVVLSLVHIDDDEGGEVDVCPAQPVSLSNVPGTAEYDSCPCAFYPAGAPACSTKGATLSEPCATLADPVICLDTPVQTLGTVLYPGPCGCPSGCFSNLGRGRCEIGPFNTGGQCVCSPGWGGPDCSLPRCPNDCGFHGSCKSGATADLDYCECDDGWTLVDCSQRTAKLEDVTIPPVDPQLEAAYWEAGGDKHGGDSHPVFDPTRISEWHIDIPPENLLQMIDSAVSVQTSNISYVDATIKTFVGAKRMNINHPIGVRIHGATTPYEGHKPLKISFTHGPGKKFLGLKAINLLPESREPSGIRDFRALSLYRAFGVAVPRHSFCSIHFNNVFWGIYWQYEGVDSEFLKSRFGPAYNDGNSSLYKCPGDGGELTPCPFFGRISCSVKSGVSGPLCDQFRAVEQAATTSGFPLGNLSDVLDISTFIRTTAVEMFLSNGDGYIRAYNNYYWFYGPPQGSGKGETRRSMILLLRDYELSQGLGLVNTSIFPTCDAAYNGGQFTGDFDDSVIAVLPTILYMRKPNSILETLAPGSGNTPLPAHPQYLEEFRSWVEKVRLVVHGEENSKEACSPMTRLTNAIQDLLKPTLPMDGLWRYRPNVLEEAKTNFVQFPWRSGLKGCNMPLEFWDAVQSKVAAEFIDATKDVSTQ